MCDTGIALGFAFVFLPGFRYILPLVHGSADLQKKRRESFYKKRQNRVHQ
jgi:hypothetical protein